MFNIIIFENVVFMLFVLLYFLVIGDKKLRCFCDDFLFLFFFLDE